jgi:hypothetical protein
VPLTAAAVGLAPVIVAAEADEAARMLDDRAGGT